MNRPFYLRPKEALSLGRLLLSLCLLFGCSARGPQAPKDERLLVRLGQESGRNHPLSLASREIARLAERDSGGRLLVRCYEDGDLGDDEDLIEQVKFGGVDIAIVGIRSLESLSRAAAALGRSGNFAQASELHAALSGALGRRLAEELEAERLMLLSWYDGGPECYLLPYARTEFRLEGLRIGVERSLSVMDEISAAGAVPVPIKMTDMRRSLESNLVEGVRAPLSLVLTNRVDADYRIYPIQDSRVPALIIGSRVSLMKLPEADRKILLGAVSASRPTQEAAQAAMVQRFLADYPNLRRVSVRRKSDGL